MTERLKVRLPGRGFTEVLSDPLRAPAFRPLPQDGPENLPGGTDIAIRTRDDRQVTPRTEMNGGTRTLLPIPSLSFKIHRDLSICRFGFPTKPDRRPSSVPG